MRVMRWVVGFSCVLAALPIASLAAQCADGTPPPCDVVATPVVKRAAPPPPDERGRSFLVLPFRNLSRLPEYDWLIESSPTILGDALGQWEEVSVVPARRLFSALRRHGLAPGEVMDEDQVRKVAEETGGWTVVEGDVLAAANRVRVRAQAYDAVTGEILVAAVEDTETDGDVLAMFEQLANHLLVAAGLDDAVADLPAATTQSLDAYKAYLRGIAHDNRSEYRQAREAFLEAVRLDSSFAQAYARVAETSVSTWEALTDPTNSGPRYAARAAALASRLPFRDRQLVQVINAFYQGRIGEARHVLERLVAADSSDLDALRWLAQVEAFDIIVDPETGLTRGSLNAAARLAKRGLSLDPSRHQFYTILMFSYAIPAGLWGGMFPGHRTERPSLGELVTKLPDAFFVPLLRDSIELVPLGALQEIEQGSLDTARSRALAVARAWVGRWLAAGPAEAEAHLWASRLDELAGDFEAALREAQTAESLGVESAWENMVAWRMVLMGKLGRYPEAVGLADSLVDVGYFARSAELIMLPTEWERAGWAMMLFLREGRMERAEAALAPLLAALGNSIGPMAGSILTEVFCGRGVGTVSPVSLPESFRRDVVAQAMRRLHDMPSGGFVPGCLIALLESAVEMVDPQSRAEIVERATTAALTMADGGHSDLAVTIAVSLVNADTTVVGRIQVLGVLRHVIALDPENLSAHYQIGKIGALTGEQLDLAEASLEYYLDNRPPAGAPTHAGAHWRLGMIFEHRKQLDRARAAYEAALELNPAHARAQAALEALKEGSR